MILYYIIFYYIILYYTLGHGHGYECQSYYQAWAYTRAWAWAYTRAWAWAYTRNELRL